VPPLDIGAATDHTRHAMSHLRTIEWIADNPEALLPGRIRLIDQTRLPLKLEYIETDDLETVWHAIKELKVRGAPAIGIAAAMGAAAAIQHSASPTAVLIDELNSAAEYLATSRPTAVNLFYALDRIKAQALSSAGLKPQAFKQAIIAEAVAIRDEDAAMCRAIGRHGAELLQDGNTVLTHCNAGSLATAEFGTALAPVYTAAGQGKNIAVYADETRPLLQGARLTAWELHNAGIEVTLICDSAAAHLMRSRKINAVMVGADRIAANGDTANKIGTYSLALAAKAHNIPFYVLAPSSTIDTATPTGEEIVIEERAPQEITDSFGRKTAPAGISVFNPAFDITPVHLISALITENGIRYYEK